MKAIKIVMAFMSLIWVLAAIVNNTAIPVIMAVTCLVIYAFFSLKQDGDNLELEVLASEYLEKLDKESDKMWCEDDDQIIEAFIDFYKKAKKANL